MAHPLAPPPPPRRNLDLPRRKSEFMRNEPAQRVIGLALERRGAHARLEHKPAVGAALDTIDRVTSAARREPHVERDAVRQSNPRFCTQCSLDPLSAARSLR